MENKINIAELLKDCPQGMELYSPIYGFGNLTKVTDRIHVKFPKEHNVKCFRLDGKVSENGEVMIFPKGKTTWEGFQRPFKNGDIVATNSGMWIGIVNHPTITNYATYITWNSYSGDMYYDGIYAFERLATEEEKEKLFDAIKANGYKWNPETKTLEKIVEPKFKVGDRVRHCRVEGSSIYRVVKIEKSKYVVHKNIGEYDYHIDFEVQDDWELVSNKFDIATLKPYDKVLCRMHDKDTWCNSFYSFYKSPHHFVTSLTIVRQCIPYEGNEHLLGKMEDCDEYYKIWE